MYRYVKPLDDGRAIFVYDLTFGRARLGIGPANALFYDDTW